MKTIVTTGVFYVFLQYMVSASVTASDVSHLGDLLNPSIDDDYRGGGSDIFEGDHPSREARKQFRKEWRMEKRKMRKERKKNRLDKTKDPVKDLDAIIPEDNSQMFSDVQMLRASVFSIWEIIGRMQNDISELKAQKMIQKESRKKKGPISDVVQSRNTNEQPVVDNRNCPEGWPQDPRQCMDEIGSVCSGRGQCLCGQCQCDAPNYGHLCGCRDDACDGFNAQLCGGSSRGQCRCNECICREPFVGVACECSMETSSCVNPDVMRSIPKNARGTRAHLCSNHGSCVCNVCQCEDGYTGKFCEDSIFSARMCERLKPCVLCKAFGVESLKCRECNINIRKVQSLEVTTKRCMMVHAGCLLQYGYNTHGTSNPTNTYEIFVPEENPKCGNL